MEITGPISLAFLVAIVLADPGLVKRESRGDGSPTPAILQTDGSKEGLNFVVGAHGLHSLSFNGQSLLASPEAGEFQSQKSVVRTVLDALVPRSSPRVARADKQADTVDVNY